MEQDKEVLGQSGGISSEAIREIRGGREVSSVGYFEYRAAFSEPRHALDSLISRIKNTTGDGATKDVEDMTYYDMFSVKPDAPISEIKKNYFKLAKDNHPDKVAQLEVAANRVGPEFRDEKGALIVVEEAKKKFQEIGHAYNVLVDPETRRQYDLHGPVQYGARGDERVFYIDLGILYRFRGFRGVRGVRGLGVLEVIGV